MPEWIHIALRSLIAIIILFSITRLFGKKQISQLTFFEYITGIAIGELAGFISTDMENNFMHGLTALVVWFTIPFSFEMLTLKSKRLRNWFEGKGRVIIKSGKVMEENLKKERYTADELLEQLRMKNVFNIADVEFAVLEANGELSVLPKKEHQPVTLSMLGLSAAPIRETQTVIIDGNIMDEPLATASLSREWLNSELEKLGVTLESVFIGQVDSYGKLTVDLYDDMLDPPTPAPMQYLLATLKKCEADLALYSLSTQSKKAQAVYEQSSNELSEIIEQVKPLLQK